MAAKQLFVRPRLRQDSLPERVLNKWSFEVLDEGFVPFPKRLVRCLGSVFKGDGSMERLALVLAITDYRRPNQSRGPSLDYLAFVSGLSAETVRERIKELQDAELISVRGDEGELHINIDGLLNQIRSKTADEL